ncbi:MAG: type II secretion system protein GspG [Sedimentisphaerales bacterium]|nr:type II secretion system protein GspG [Sedimentisphaerales bacterium]
MESRKGVTLVELLIVVVILGALAAISIPRITASSTTAKANACAANIDIMNSQIEMYRADTGSYPSTLTALVSDPNYFPDGLPVCPSGGTYSMSGNRVSCDASGH